MDKSKLKLLYGGNELREKIKLTALEIEKDYCGGEPLVCVCVLRGAVMFFTELVKQLAETDVIIDFITVSSYGNCKCSSGEVTLKQDVKEDVENKRVLIVEDIVDSGRTVKFLRAHFASKGALSVKVASLIDKPSARKVNAHADYNVITLEGDKFIVGFGLDLRQSYRHLDGIYEVF